MLSNSDKDAILAQCYANVPVSSTRDGDAITEEGFFYHGNMKYYGEAKREVTLHLNPALVDHLCATGNGWERRVEDFLTDAYAAHRI